MKDFEALEDLSRAYRFLQGPGSSACPEAPRLVALALQDLRGDERTSLAEHVVACAPCARDYRIVLDAHQEAADELPDIQVARWSGWRLAAFAVGLFAIAVGVVQLRPFVGPASIDAVRGGRATQREAVSPAQESVLTAAPSHFAWPSVPRSTRYELTLFDVEGRLLFSSGGLEEPLLDLPTPVQDVLRSGRRYFWIVAAENEGTRARMGPYWFRISDSAQGAR